MLVLKKLLQKIKESRQPSYDKIYNHPYNFVPETVGLYDCIPYLPPIVCGRVVKVVDGDTIKIACNLESSIVKNIQNDTMKRERRYYIFTVRLNQVNCPEKRSRNKDKDLAFKEKMAAEFVTQQVYNRIYNDMVGIEVISYDSFGRLIANISHHEQDISQWLMQNHYAVLYKDTDKNKDTIDWIEYINDETLTNQYTNNKNINPIVSS